VVDDQGKNRSLEVRKHELRDRDSPWNGRHRVFPTPRFRCAFGERTVRDGLPRLSSLCRRLQQLSRNLYQQHLPQRDELRRGGEQARNAQKLLLHGDGMRALPCGQRRQPAHEFFRRRHGGSRARLHGLPQRAGVAGPPSGERGYGLFRLPLRLDAAGRKHSASVLRDHRHQGEQRMQSGGNGADE
jgi:hypothetical protein